MGGGGSWSKTTRGRPLVDMQFYGLVYATLLQYFFHSPKKMVQLKKFKHTHEIRHWIQIPTFLQHREPKLAA
jgi:hypothetical protein